MNIDKAVFIIIIIIIVSSALEILPVRACTNIQKNTVLLQQQMRPMQRGGCEQQSSCLTDILVYLLAFPLDIKRNGLAVVGFYELTCSDITNQF